MNERAKVDPSQSIGQISIFGAAPVLHGEDSDAYNALLAQLSGSVKANDIFEEIWLREIADSTWEILRYRRLKTSLIAAGMKDILSKIILGIEHRSAEGGPKPLFSPRELVAGWLARKPGMIEEVNDLLASSGLTIDHVIAQSLALELNNVERFDLLMAISEKRREIAFRELDRHRAILARTLRDSVKNVEGAEFSVV
jgi:hypothetical protein